MQILFEDNHIIAVNKNVSELVQGDRTGDEPLSDRVKQYIKNKYNKPGDVFLGVPHRLDRPVSGVVLFARTSKALSRLSRMFQEKEIRKFYLAVVKNRPPGEEGKLSHYLKKNEAQNRSFAYNNNVKESKEALLAYKLISRADRYYLLEIELYTGRHHQIRSQLAAVGCPIKGDLKYGYNQSNENKGINLHAWKVSFMHPVKKEQVVIEAPLPNEDIWSIYKNTIKEWLHE